MDNSPQMQRQAQQDDVIDLVDLFFVLLDNIWKIIICMILGGALMLSYTFFFVTPQYRATSKIYMVSASSNSVINFSDLQLGNSIKYDYQELIKSRPLMEKVIENLGLSYTPSQLNNMLSISNPTDTRVLNITITSPDPVMSMNIANEVAKQAIVTLPDIMESEAPNLVESAIVPTSAYSPSYSKNLLMGVAAGFVLCCGILVVKYLMDDSFKSAEDVQHFLGMLPLAVVPENNGSSNGGYGYGYGKGSRKGRGKKPGKSEE